MVCQGNKKRRRGRSSHGSGFGRRNWGQWTVGKSERDRSRGGVGEGWIQWKTREAIALTERQMREPMEIGYSLGFRGVADNWLATGWGGVTVQRPRLGADLTSRGADGGLMDSAMAAIHGLGIGITVIGQQREGREKHWRVQLRLDGASQRRELSLSAELSGKTIVKAGAPHGHAM